MKIPSWRGDRQPSEGAPSFLALANAPNKLVFAALVGGDLGPRLLPIGSVAGLLWTHQLRQKG